VDSLEQNPPGIRNVQFWEETMFCERFDKLLLESPSELMSVIAGVQSYSTTAATTVYLMRCRICDSTHRYEEPRDPSRGFWQALMKRREKISRKRAA
jgi:hypothetical protein